MKVEICSDRVAWDRYVEGEPGASNYHRWMWREAIEESFPHKAYYLAAMEGDGICGVLPLVHVRSRLFNDALVSMPYLNYGGVLASQPQAAEALLREAAVLAQKLKVRHVELRHRECNANNWVEATPKVTMEVALPANMDDMWNGLSSGMRNKIRGARNKQITVSWLDGIAVDEFYKVFSENMRDLGTPILPKKWFSNLSRYAAESVRFVILQDGDETVAAGMTTSYRDCVELPCSAALQKSRKKNTAILMYWSVFEWAHQQGFKRVDLGRCTHGGGTWEFKRHWNPEEIKLHWYYWLSNGAQVPELRPDNPKFSMAVKVWKKLPLAAANALGPRIAPSLP